MDILVGALTRLWFFFTIHHTREDMSNQNHVSGCRNVWAGVITLFGVLLEVLAAGSILGDLLS